MTSGIYVIRNTTTGQRYIGSAADLADRRRNHFNRLQRGNHRNHKLQAAWNKYGPESFEFDVLFLCGTWQLREQEQHLLDTCAPEYNISVSADCPARGKPWSPERRARQTGIKRGPLPDAVKEKIAAKLRGRKLSPEHREKVAAAGRLNLKKTQAPEVIARRAETRRNNHASPSIETRRKISQANKGNNHRLGLKHSEDARRSMSLGQHRRWARERERTESA